MIKKAVFMHLPDGKLPGFYARLVKELAESGSLFDRDKELLILNDEEDMAAIAGLLRRFQAGFEELDLLLLPPDAETGHLFDDYGFVSRIGNRYLYMHLAAVFRLEDVGGSPSEKEQALLQLEESVIVRFRPDEEWRYAVDRELKELAERTAKAYGCKAVFES